jgi:copper(I)-binding protein
MKFRRIGVASLAVASALAFAGPVSAHDSPKAGSPCGMSGMAKTVHSKTYVCQSKDGKTTWSRGLPVSKARLTAKDTWAKAANSGMTAVFGVISNPTNQPIRVIAATTSFAPTQLHEVVKSDGQMVMKETARGFVVPARGQLELKPGGDHIMLMKLSKPIKAGTQVPVTLITSTGGTASFRAMGKPFAGGNEQYDPGHGSHNSGM